MAKTLKQLDNKIRIKKLVRDGKFYLFFGSQQIYVDTYGYPGGFIDMQSAIDYGNGLEKIGDGIYRIIH